MCCSTPCRYHDNAVRSAIYELFNWFWRVYMMSDWMSSSSLFGNSILLVFFFYVFKESYLKPIERNRKVHHVIIKLSCHDVVQTKVGSPPTCRWPRVSMWVNLDTTNRMHFRGLRSWRWNVFYSHMMIFQGARGSSSCRDSIICCVGKAVTK